MNIFKFLHENSNIFNVSSVAVGIVTGFLAWFFGGFDTLLITLFVLSILDYITGIIKAIYIKRLSSEIGYKGIIKKVTIYIIVGLSVMMQAVLPQSVPLREMTIMFFFCNEALSILENVSEIIPIPEKLKNVLMQLRKNGEKSKDKMSSDENDDDAL